MSDTLKEKMAERKALRKKKRPQNKNLKPYKPGQSGNPSGRPKGKKNEITELKQNLEIAVRNSVSPQDVIDIVQAMVAEAKAGKVGAAKVILDKTISNVKETEDTQSGDGRTFVFEVKNLTLKSDPIPDDVIDVTPQEIDDGDRSQAEQSAPT